MYSSTIANAELGAWYFPVSEKQFFIVYFDRERTKADATYAKVCYALDAIAMDSDSYDHTQRISDDLNVYEPAKLVSEKSGVYTFSLSATVYSGDKKTYTITIDRNKETCEIK